MDIKELIKRSDEAEIYTFLKKAKKAYDDGHPIISDADWDELEAAFLDINENSDFFDIVETSVDGFEHADHVLIMGSLNKTKRYEEKIGSSNGYEELHDYLKDRMMSGLRLHQSPGFSDIFYLHQQL